MGDSLSEYDPFGLSKKVKSKCSPAEEAAGWQGKGDYPGVDKWKNSKLKKGDIVYGGTPGQTEFYTDAASIIKSKGNKEKYWGGLQVKPNEKHGLREEITAYRVKKDISVAHASTKANTDWGDGGSKQYYIPDFKNSLEPIHVIKLHS